MRLWQEFKAFAFKGNVVDLAVAVIIGAAFGKIVSALVADIVMPIVGLVMPGGDWRKYEVSGLHIKIGDFAGAVIDFLIIAAALFLIVKLVTRAYHGAAATKTCPECLESIPAGAKRCRACTAAQPA